MISEEDKEYLNNPHYSMALEKFYDPYCYAEKDLLSANGTINKAYPFSNEKLFEIFKHVRGRDKRVLTVGSSGDQLFNALYYGAKDVTVMDANLYAKPYIDYKMAAIRNLSYEEFRYFFLLFKDPFNQSVYGRIFHELDAESQAFWGSIFMEQEDSLETYNKFCRSSDVKTLDIDSSFYLNPRSYKRLQNILRQQDFKFDVINAEFGEFTDKAEGKYDLILLSNVHKYVHTANVYVRTINSLYDNHLNDGGEIQLNYEFQNIMRKPSERFGKMFPDKNIQGLPIDFFEYTYLLRKPHTKTNSQDMEEDVLTTDN